MRYPEQPIRSYISPLACALAAAACLLAAAGTAAAQEEATGVRSMGMGNANRAVATGNDAIYLNPAGMSLSRRYSVEANYQYDTGREVHAPGGSIVDSVTSPVAAGVAYGYVSGKKTLATTALDGTPLTNNVDRTGQFIHVGMSMPLGRNAAVGVAGKYVDVSYGGRNAANAIGVDAGLLFRASPNVALSVTGYGLTNTGSAEAPLQVGVGLALGPPGSFVLAVDWVADFTSAKYNESLTAAQRKEGGTRHQIMAGLEYTFAKAFSIRAGYFHDRVTRLQPDNAITFGLGFYSARNRFGFQVAFQQRLLNTDERIITGGVQIFL